MNIEDILPKDTDLPTLAKYYEILGRISIDRKIEMFFEFNNRMRQTFCDGIKMLHPDWNEKQIRFEVIRRLYGVDLEKISE